MIIQAVNRERYIAKPAGAVKVPYALEKPSDVVALPSLRIPLANLELEEKVCNIVISRLGVAAVRVNFIKRLTINPIPKILVIDKRLRGRAYRQNPKIAVVIEMFEYRT